MQPLPGEPDGGDRPVREGYHVVGHTILEYWEKQRPGQPEYMELMRRAEADIRLLVSFLDADAALLVSLVDGYITGGPRRKAQEAAGPQPAVAAPEAAPPPIAWPAKEFATLGDLGKWVYQRHKIGMTAILRKVGKSRVSEMTLAEAKAAAEQILRETQAKTDERGKTHAKAEDVG